MKPLSEYPQADLKLVYQVLQAQLRSNPDLLDNAVLEDLQSFLQGRAKADGVDPTYHPAWAAWLRGEPAPPVPTGPRLKLVED